MFEASTALQAFSAQDACENAHPAWTDFTAAADRVLEIGGHLSSLLMSAKRGSGGLVEALLQEFPDVQEVHTLIKDLVIAAADTTSYSTLWTLHLLATHPDTQQRARNSVKSGSKVSNTCGILCTKKTVPK